MSGRPTLSKNLTPVAEPGMFVGEDTAAFDEWSRYERRQGRPSPFAMRMVGQCKRGIMRPTLYPPAEQNGSGTSEEAKVSEIRR